MSFALPVVATRWRGIQSMVDDGTTGFLVPTEDPRALGDRLHELIASPDRRQAFGQAGRDRFRNDYTSDRYLERIAGLLRSVAGKEPNRSDAATTDTH